MIFKISDLNQYHFCSRIIYYSYCFPVEKNDTTKMKIGKDYHERIESLEKRRVLERYGLDAGVSYFEKYFYSETLCLSLTVQKQKQIKNRSCINKKFFIFKKTEKYFQTETKKAG